MSKELKVHVGGGFDALSKRTAEAWHRAERGEPVSENHLTFESWKVLSNVMTPKRLDLLRHLHKYPAASIAALARALKRDYKRVHEDVETLAMAGLLERGPDGIHVEFSEIRTVIAVN